MRKPRISLAGFKDPVRRPRFVVWTLVGVLGVAAFAVFMIGATSTRAFCANQVCHKVQGDTMSAYQASTHANISCIACHEPAGADPVTFLLLKVKMMGGIPPTLSNAFSLPINPGSALALAGGTEMGSAQCTQCHSTNRKVTTRKSLIIDHEAHAEAGVWCTVCHNRIAHNERKAPPTHIDPKGHQNVAHPDFMKMDYCFRCHDLERRLKMTGPEARSAPGACRACHPRGFDLVPETHDTRGWKRAGHAEAAAEAFREVGAGEVEAEELEEEGVQAHLAAPVNTCFTCHVEAKFCRPCHSSLKVPGK